MLRATFIALSESRWLRAVAERSRLGQRASARFVAGTQVADAIRATASINQFGASVSIDNVGENVTNAEEARASAQLYHQLLDEIAGRQAERKRQPEADPHGPRRGREEGPHENVRGLVAKAASMSPREFCSRRMEGSPYTQRTFDFVRSLHREPGQRNRVGTVIQSYMYAQREGRRSFALRSASASGCAKAPTRKRRDIAFPRRRPRSMPTT